MVVANGCWGECAAVAARSDESLSFVVTVQLTGWINRGKMIYSYVDLRTGEFEAGKDGSMNRPMDLSSSGCSGAGATAGAGWSRTGRPERQTTRILSRTGLVLAAGGR